MGHDLQLETGKEPLRRIKGGVRRVRSERLPGVVPGVPERERPGADHIVEDCEVRDEESGDVSDIQSAPADDNIAEREQDQDDQNGDRGEVGGAGLDRSQVTGIVTSCAPFGNSAITPNSSASPSKLVLCLPGRG